MAVTQAFAEPHSNPLLVGSKNALRSAGGVPLLMIMFLVLTGCQSGPTTSSAPMYGQSTIPPPGTANTALARPGTFAASAPPMANPGTVNGWGTSSMNGSAPPGSWNSPSIFGGSAPPPVNGTAWNPNQPPNGYGAQGSIFDQAPATQRQGILDSFAGQTSGYPGGSFNPGSTTRGYDSPNSSFVGAMPAHSDNRPAPLDTGNGSWWDRLTGTKSTVPAAGNPGWNQPVPMGAPNPAVAWNDPRNPNFQRQPIPNPNAMATNGWNIAPPPAAPLANPLNTAPSYTNYGTAPANTAPNILSRTLPASTNPLRPTNTLPAGWSNNGLSTQAASAPPATGPAWIKSLEDLPPAR